MPPRILVVDDEPMVRALIARALTDEGYEVVAVANGLAALDAARGAEAPFNMIVTNNYMPGLSGAELIQRAREDFPTCRSFTWTTSPGGSRLMCSRKTYPLFISRSASQRSRMPSGSCWSDTSRDYTPEICHTPRTPPFSGSRFSKLSFWKH